MRSISRRSGAPDMRGPYQPNLGFETPDSSARQLFPCTATLFPFDSRVLDLRGKLFWDHHILTKALTFASPILPIGRRHVNKPRGIQKSRVARTPASDQNAAPPHNPR